MARTLFNPFPGLRPFEPDEDHLFFGREREIDDLLHRLGSHRFLAVIGTSGSGKSSLVRSGLIPSLHGGSVTTAGSNWRVSVMRPGEDPIGQLARALDAPDVIGAADAELADTNSVLLDATLRRGTLGLVDAVRLARIPRTDNLLVVVDQFEELFRFRRSRHAENSRDEAVVFVKLLLEAVSQQALPIYVVLTMRSDFIGDCMAYPGLPEAINDSLYLVPRMTRDELRSAITGPVAVAGGHISPRLVLRLLNDVGDDQDQLPLMQHVLMRTWNHWSTHRRGAEPIDLENYEAVGTLKDALSRHAEEAYQETGSDENHRTTALMFKALTDTFSDPRGVRRPTSVADLAAICEAPESDITRIVEIFRSPGRSFLMPPAAVPLTSRTIVDLSHESLMRCWTRLIEWAQEERASAALYVRLSREAGWWREGAAGLWGDPELELGLRWKRENRPTAAWARRFDEAFDRAMEYLDRSETERDRAKAERRAQRIRNLQIAWGSAAVLLVMFVIAALTASFARRESSRAEANLRLAKNAVDETLAATDRDPARIGADVPEMDAFRRELLGRAKRFYDEFIKQKPGSEEFLNEMAFAYFRLGHINRMLEVPQEATQEYREAISRFESLSQSSPAKPEYRAALANSWNWLGETLRPFPDKHGDAETAYANALRIQDELVRTYPQNAAYKQELARTYYNRGSLRGSSAAPGESAFRLADADFREAIRFLEPIARSSIAVQPRQELARAYNNLANLLAQDKGTSTASAPLYEQAIGIHADLVAHDPANREYKLELAKFSNNLAGLQRERGNIEPAGRANARAIALLDDLVRSAPSLAIELADAHDLRGQILQAQGSADATGEYARALELFDKLSHAPGATARSDFHVRFGDLLLNLAFLRRERPADEAVRRVLSEAVAFYASLAREALASGRPAEARSVLDNLSRLLPELIDRDRRAVMGPYQDLRQALDRASSNPR